MNIQTEQVTRKDHLEWCKQRAIKLANEGNLAEAFASMSSDLQKHTETADHIGIQLGFMLMTTNTLNTKVKMIKFIDDFN